MNILVTGANGQLGNSIQKIHVQYPEHKFIFTDVPEVDITNLDLLRELVKKEQMCGIHGC